MRLAGQKAARGFWDGAVRTNRFLSVWRDNYETSFFAFKKLGREYRLRGYVTLVPGRSSFGIGNKGETDAVKITCAEERSLGPAPRPKGAPRLEMDVASWPFPSFLTVVQVAASLMVKETFVRARTVGRRSDQLRISIALEYWKPSYLDLMVADNSGLGSEGLRHQRQKLPATPL